MAGRVAVYRRSWVWCKRVQRLPRNEAEPLEGVLAPVLVVRTSFSTRPEQPQADQRERRAISFGVLQTGRTTCASAADRAQFTPTRAAASPSFAVSAIASGPTRAARAGRACHTAHASRAGHAAGA